MKKESEFKKSMTHIDTAAVSTDIQRYLFLKAEYVSVLENQVKELTIIKDGYDVDKCSSLHDRLFYQIEGLNAIIKRLVEND